MSVRIGESTKEWFRGERFVIVNGQWFFSTRERRDVGPFTSKAEAVTASKSFFSAKGIVVQNWMDSMFSDVIN